MSRRDYGGGAVPTTITSGINATDLAIPIAVATGWPVGTNGKFYVVVYTRNPTDGTHTNEEKILVTSRSGLNLTVASTGDRGVDGTSAQTHASGSVIEHCFAAPDVDEPNAHINDTGLDHHTQYLNTTRHADPAKHLVGTSITAGTPGSSHAGDTAAVGVATTVAASDHKHAREVAPTAASVAASESTASTSYTDLTTPGPARTVVTSTTALVIVTAKIDAAAYGYMSFAVSGASTVAASDTRAVEHGTASTDAARMSSVSLVTGLTAGSNTFTAKYRTAFGTALFSDRDIIVIAL